MLLTCCTSVNLGAAQARSFSPPDARRRLPESAGVCNAMASEEAKGR